MTIWFDMDGTLNRFYDVPDWLPKLRSSDPSPYAEAAVNLNMSLVARYLNKLQKLGYQIGIISWLAMNSTSEYDEAVDTIKRKWLENHLHSVSFDFIHITEYGIPKQSFKNSDDDILFDDNEAIRNDWGNESYEPAEIISILKSLLTRE